MRETIKSEFFSVSDVAGRLGVTDDTVLAWIKSKDLAAMDVSRGRGERPRWRISEADLRGFLDRRRTQTSCDKSGAKKRCEARKIPRHV